MKSIAVEVAYFFRGRARQNLKVLCYYGLFLLCLVLLYATIFDFLMWRLEGRDFSFIASIYWVITVMTTLGFGDITFHTDLGYLFAAIVTITGVIFMLIILPFGLISMFLAPWIEQRLRYKPTLELPENTAGHVLIFGVDPITISLIRKLKNRHIPFVVVTPDVQTALRLEEDNIKVVCGSPFDRAVLERVRVGQARYVIANLSDPENANICLTVRSMAATPIATIANEPEHSDLLRLAGANQVVPLPRIIGRYLATRATTRGAQAHVLDSFGQLQIAEMPVHGTPFVGQTLEQARIRQRTGLAVVALWERGHLKMPAGDTLLTAEALMILAGTKAQLENLEQLAQEHHGEELVFILGHGRIGCAAAKFLERKPVSFVLLDQHENPDCSDHVTIIGDATGRLLLKKAGIDQGHGVIITTNSDNTNIFLTLSSRHSNPSIRIVARANDDANVEQLYAAGADFVVSNASVGASILNNILESKESVFLTEGITVFRRALPDTLVGTSIADSQIRPLTGCSIVALEQADGSMPLIMPPPEQILRQGMGLILIGGPQQEELFSRSFAVA
ncbi:MAG: potassium channel family protein [Desulfuromonadaceae bacterium]